MSTVVIVSVLSKYVLDLRVSIFSNSVEVQDQETNIQNIPLLLIELPHIKGNEKL